MQVPPGHMVQQVVDQTGTLLHVILSPDPMTMGPGPQPAGPAQPAPLQAAMVGSKSILELSLSKASFWVKQYGFLAFFVHLRPKNLSKALNCKKCKY